MDPTILESELLDSRNEIAKRTGQAVGGFAYPYGTDLTSYVRMAPVLEKCGFQYACTALPIINDCRTNKFLLRRMTLPGTVSMSILNGILMSAFAVATP